MKELLINLFGAVQDRVKNRLVGAYVVSFIVCNWWPISIFLFSNKNIEDKVEFINSSYNKPSAFLWPFIISCLYIVLLPYLNAIFDLVVTKANFLRIKNRSEVKLESLKQGVQIAKIEREIAVERAGTNEMESLRVKLETKENEYAELIKKIEEAENNYKTEYKIWNQALDNKKGEVIKANTEIDNLKTELNHYKKVYPFLILEGVNSEIEIEHFLKSYLDKDEILMLKEIAGGEVYSKLLPFRNVVKSLLIKAKHFEYNRQDDIYKITDAGSKFATDKI